jgi:hypothetical protein
LWERHDLGGVGVGEVIGHGRVQMLRRLPMFWWRWISFPAALILARYLSRLIQKLDSPVWCPPHSDETRRPIAPYVYEVQSHASLALPITLLAVVAMGQGLVAFEMPLATCQTARPDAFGLDIPFSVRMRCRVGFGIVPRTHPFDLLDRFHAGRIGRIFPLLRRPIRPLKIHDFGLDGLRREMDILARRIGIRVSRLQQRSLVDAIGQCRCAEARRPTATRR